MKNFRFNIPVKIIYGKGKIAELKNELGNCYENIMIVTDKTIHQKTDTITKLTKILKGKNITIFDDVEENPSIPTVDNGGSIARENNIDMVIGAGGGSVLDAAKGMAIMAKNKESIKQYLNGLPLKKNPVPNVCVPTTSGTGSEVTPFAVFTDRDEENKIGYGHDKIFPEFSIIDPELTYSMPRNIIINTGLDALTHSIEAYLSTEAFDLNDQIALRSVEVVIDSLAAASDKNPEAMDAMAYASMLGGIAIAHASTILPHIMGYPLTVFHQFPHGLANAVLMPAFLDYMREHSFCKNKIKVLDNMFLKVGGVQKFINSLGVSTKLIDYGVLESSFNKFVEKTIVKGDVKITPANITREVIYNLYRKAYN